MKKAAICGSGSGPSPDTASAGALISDLRPPDVRTIHVFLSQPVDEILLQQPKQTKMVRDYRRAGDQLRLSLTSSQGLKEKRRKMFSDYVVERPSARSLWQPETISYATEP